VYVIVMCDGNGRVDVHSIKLQPWNGQSMLPGQQSY
jgi:hypothetical protein